MHISPPHIIMGLTIHGWTHNLYETGEYTFMELPEYSIIFPSLYSLQFRNWFFIFKGNSTVPPKKGGGGVWYPLVDNLLY